jgi:hypothetical protein
MEVDLTEGVHVWEQAGWEERVPAWEPEEHEEQRPPRLTRQEQYALESAHEAVRRAELRGRRPLVGRLAKRSLEDALANEREVLDRLGLDSYESGRLDTLPSVRAERPPTRAVLIALWHAAEAARIPEPRVTDLCPRCDRLMQLTRCSCCHRFACADCLPHVSDPRGGWLCVPCALLFAGVRVRPVRNRFPVEPVQP